jgi:hypothetical protein
VGGFADSEIPLLLMLFYLYHDVASSRPRGRLVLDGSLCFIVRVSYVEDIVRWGVWLGRHIC